ncbi:MAG: acyl CoA:acetate/3-ketoacid CoA transferase, partial [Acidobacteria bacterium]|nr:acyl CoA:acetate/3-ketoacid CoA transferase [Acidobacteriota bacterium]
MARTPVRFLSASDAVRLIPHGATVATAGFVGCGHPEELTAEVERCFLEAGSPRDLTLIYAAGQGDGVSRGLNHLGHPGLVRRVVGGHWNLAPRLCALATSGQIEAYNFPQGVIAKLFREIAAGNPGLLSRTGLGTYIDPRHGGGRINASTTRELVEVVSIGGQEMLFYQALPIDVALIRGTSSDSRGNISFEREVMTGETLAMAMAARNSGGIVIAQVERLAPAFSRDPKLIHVPGIFVDVVVVSSPERHMQTFGEQFAECYVEPGPLSGVPLPNLEPGPRRYIAARCLD